MKSKLRNKMIFLITLLLSSLLLASCQKTTPSTQSPTSTPTSDAKSTENTPTLSPTSVPTLYNLPELDSKLTYRSYQASDDLTVYISESEHEQHIVIASPNSTASFEWDYNLTFGDPIVTMDRKGNTDTEALYIILPTSETEAILNVEEICGTAHIIDPITLAEYEFIDEIELLKEWTSIAYEFSGDDTNEIFTLAISPSWAYYYFYPQINLPRATYQVVLEDKTYFCASLTEYRRVGIEVNDEILWLGKFCDDITLTNISSFDSNQFHFVFLPYEDIQYTLEEGLSFGNTMTREERMLAGNMINIDPDDALDLNQDGKLDQISYRSLPASSNYDFYQQYSLTVNQTTIIFTGDNLSSVPYVGSLDGKTMQVMIFDYGPSADPSIHVYVYNGSVLSYAGSIPSYNYTLTKDGKITAQCESYHIQCFPVPFVFSFEDGIIKEIKQDFYPQGNTVTVLQDITLYENKDSKTLGVTLSAGSKAIIVGSDLSQWVYIQDIKTKEFGWLETTDGYNNCFLPDGRALPSTELFDGLYFYG